MTFKKAFPLHLSPSPTISSTASTTTTPLRSVSFSSCASSVSPSVPLTRGGGYRRQPVIFRDASPAKLSARIGEVAGGTAAECAAICCCWPWGLLDLIVTAVVKLPAGLAKRAYKKRRRRRRLAALGKAALLESYGGGGDEESERMKEEWGIPVAEPTPELVAMEKEMWSTFYGTGFWRSPSQREKGDR